jgi:hypothetical protein
MAYLTDAQDRELISQFNAMMKAVEAGVYHHPQEIWDMCQQLFEAGHDAWAQRLGEYLPDQS